MWIAFDLTNDPAPADGAKCPVARVMPKPQTRRLRRSMKLQTCWPPNPVYQKGVRHLLAT
jgi:hypothetical protein